MRPMALTNAQKQARFRERNTIVLTADAQEIAEKLMDMEDQAKLHKIHRWVGNHLKNPKRSLTERYVDLGRIWIGAHGGNKGRKRVAAEAAEILRLEAVGKARMIEEDLRIAVVKDALKAGLITQKQFD